MGQEDEIGSEPDSVLPAQFEHQAQLTGERRLLWTLLLGAVAALSGHGRRVHGPRTEAKAWLLGERDSRVTFLALCEHLDLDPALTRRWAFDLAGAREGRRTFAGAPRFTLRPRAPLHRPEAAAA